MPLYLHSGGLLVRNGGIAAGADCCCNPPLGACCFPSAEGSGYSCASATQQQCNAMGGVWQGEGTECGYEECGACCREPVCYVPASDTFTGPQCLDGYFLSTCQSLGGYPCDPAGREPNQNGVYFCSRNITQVTITASGHTFAPNPAVQAKLDLAEQYMNSTYVVQLPCYGYNFATFDLGGGWAMIAGAEFVQSGAGFSVTFGLSENGFKWCATGAYATYPPLPPESGCTTLFDCADADAPALFNVNSGYCGADNLAPRPPSTGYPLIGDAKYEWTFA